MTTGCWRLVWSSRLQREFPTSGTFDHLHMNDRLREAIDTCDEAPWFCRDAIAVGSICWRYADVEGWLPCRVSLWALKTFSWRQCFCFMHRNLFQDRDATLAAARQAVVMLVLSDLSCGNLFEEVSKELSLETFQFCTKGEVEYVKRLVVLNRSLVPSWAGCVDVDDRATCFAQPQVYVDFHYLEKVNS